jgi:hypothetical protein
MHYMGHNGRVPRHSTVGLKAQDVGHNGRVPRHGVINTVGILFYKGTGYGL